MNILHYFTENIVPNLLASLIWVIPGTIWGHFHVKGLHRKLDAQSAKLSLLHKHIKETRTQ